MIFAVSSDVFLFANHGNFTKENEFASLETKPFSINSKALPKCDLFPTGLQREDIFYLKLKLVYPEHYWSLLKFPHLRKHGETFKTMFRLQCALICHKLEKYLSHTIPIPFCLFIPAASASASFFEKFSASVSVSHLNKHTVSDAYTKNVMDSTVYTYGGPPVRDNFSISYWEENLANNLVAIDREGDPLHYLITTEALPELPEEVTFKLSALVLKSLQRYYKNNAITGTILIPGHEMLFFAMLFKSERTKSLHYLHNFHLQVAQMQIPRTSTSRRI